MTHQQQSEAQSVGEGNGGVDLNTSFTEPVPQEEPGFFDRFTRVGLMLAALSLPTAVAGCTANERAKHFGGTQTVEVEPGRKVIDVTWKDDDIWYATRPMHEGEEPETIEFKQKSSYGIMEGQVNFVEQAPK